MKRLLIIFLLAMAGQTFAQVLHPATWTYKMSLDTPKVGDEIDLIFEAYIDADWYLYSTDFDPELGPLITEFKFTPHESYELIGEIQAINPQRKYDSLWEGEITFFKKKGWYQICI